jgi:uncharacterized damage-inducible protein DinB
MTDKDPKATLQRYLQRGREALLWKLDGLSEYDSRRPLTPTGTNLLGLVKHVAWVEAEYFSSTFDRPFGLPEWLTVGQDEDNADMWATAEQTREQIVAFYREVWANSDATIEALELDAEGHVPWWGDRNPVTLHWILVHMIAETERHAGQADIVRETIDGAVGLGPRNSNVPDHDEAWWRDYVARLESTAVDAGHGS